MSAASPLSLAAVLRLCLPAACLMAFLAGPAQPSGNVTLTLALLSANPAAPLTPVSLEVTITNPADTATTVPVPTLSDRDSPYNTLDIYYSRNGSPPRRIGFVIPNFTDWREGIEPPRPTTETLAPGQHVVIDADVSYDFDPNGPVSLIEPGTVQFSARLCDLTTDGTGALDVLRDQGTDSNSITVSVQSSGRAKGKAVLTDLKELPRPWLLCAPQFAGAVGDSADFVALRAFVDRNADTGYASYARAALAGMTAAGEQREGRFVRQPDAREAVRLLDAALGDARFRLRKTVRAWRDRLADSLPAVPGRH